MTRQTPQDVARACADAIEGSYVGAERCVDILARFAREERNAARREDAAELRKFAKEYIDLNARQGDPMPQRVKSAALHVFEDLARIIESTIEPD